MTHPEATTGRGPDAWGTTTIPTRRTAPRTVGGRGPKPGIERSRAALALENARLYRERRAAAWGSRASRWTFQA
jgi:hypothetical protein